MVCIYCHSPSQVVNSRLQRRSNNIWRRRKCISCGSVFTSIESAVLETNLMVSRKKLLTPFNRDALYISIYESCKHRPKSISDASALTQTVLDILTKIRHGAIVERNDIVKTTADVLQRFDTTAATIYAAYHPLA